MKHDAECTCRECKRRDAAPPSSRITIPLAEVSATIAESVRAVLESHGMAIHRQSSHSFVTTVDGSALADLLREIGNNSAACLQGLDETPDDEPLPKPRAVSARGRR